MALERTSNGGSGRAPAGVKTTGRFMQQSILAILHLTNTLEETRAQVLALAVGRVDGVGDVRFDPPDE